MLDASDWTLFVHKTIDFKVFTKIECGSACNYLADQCNMFIHIDEDCHVGNYNNGNQNILSGLSGDFPAYLDLGRLGVIIT